MALLLTAPLPSVAHAAPAVNPASPNYAINILVHTMLVYSFSDSPLVKSPVFTLLLFVKWTESALRIRSHSPRDPFGPRLLNRPSMPCRKTGQLFLAFRCACTRTRGETKTRTEEEVDIRVVNSTAAPVIHLSTIVQAGTHFTVSDLS
ncbi:hypothetical protein EDD36DRAFT_263497 [Exophiala viscosa]|uniref:Uncharacterized protein n=1 Tax=Exophiala viscosa TaxID=2486360 RepID=A0AAN6IFA2_9EURO|nr:hypothetical protein EDD36DRAFT_263497 [Exophiala viscosa]